MAVTRIRTIEDVAAHVEATLHLGPPATIGAELEWHATDPAAPYERPSLPRVDRALAGVTLAGGSVLTTEPGGQVELSSAPYAGVAALIDGLAADVAGVRAALLADGLELLGEGTDPLRAPERLLELPRYRVMEEFFAAEGPAGKQMMCSTAAVQVSVDAGLPGEGAQSATARWQRAHAVGPALVAAFACSPFLLGEPTGWCSTRQAIWLDVDESRTRPPDPTSGPVQATVDLAMAARLMCVRDTEGICREAPTRTFGQWLAARDGPTVDDLDYHLTTLFPPVRARGWYELRYLDALPDPLWQVAVEVVAAVLDDDRVADAARAACAPVEGRWRDAARLGVADPELQQAATGVLAAVGGQDVEAFLEWFTLRGRCPADDRLSLVCA